MKLETFFEKFDLFADVADAVKKMRELILESAIRGNLVPQNASDEPASTLLRRIETQSSVQAGKARKQAVLPPVGDDAYLQIPTGWEWTRLGNTGRIFNGNSVSESGKAELSNVEDGLPFIATKDVGYGRDTLVYDNGLEVPRGDSRFKVARAKTVLICAEGGSAGRKIGITDRDICFGNKLYANEVWVGIHHRYIFYVYQVPTVFKEFAARMTGIIGGISRSEFLSLPVPLPPEEEQQRIVAKVDELMALCDRLEEQKQERETRHASLARASLARFADAPTPANLEFIFHKSYDVTPADLRKSILTLAVQGKLVPQDPNDEPAETILARVAATKLRLQKTGEIGKEKPAESLQPESLPFEAPESWRWAKLAELTELITKGSSPKWQGIAYVPESEGVLFITSKNVGNYLLRKLDDLKYVAKEFNEIEPRSILKRGDILMNLVGASIGRTAVYDLHDGANINQAVALIRLVRETDGIHPRFLLHYLNSPSAIDHMLSSRVINAQPNISLTDAREFAVPIPPLTEQHRIVAKVDQLMALVDALETQLADSSTTSEKLLEAVVADLTRSN